MNYHTHSFNGYFSKYIVMDMRAKRETDQNNIPHISGLNPNSFDKFCGGYDKGLLLTGSNKRKSFLHNYNQKHMKTAKSILVEWDKMMNVIIGDNELFDAIKTFYPDTQPPFVMVTMEIFLETCKMYEL